MMLLIIFSLLTGYVVDVEVHTPNGRVDIVLLTDIRLYIIELKLNRDAQTALQQINLKNYAQRFALCGKPIVKVGINFDSTQGNIADWMIEEEWPGVVGENVTASLVLSSFFLIVFLLLRGCVID